MRRGVTMIGLLCCFIGVLTPAAAQESCTAANVQSPEIMLTLDENGGYAGAKVMLPILLDYLNGGGSAESLPESLKTATQVANAQNTNEWGLFWRWRIDHANVFGDEAEELLVEVAGMGGKREDSFLDAALFAFTCQEGAYVGYLVGDYGGVRGGGFMDEENGVFAIVDMTGDGLAEVVVTRVSNVGIHANYDREFMIFGWNGDEFIPLISPVEYFGMTYWGALAFLGSGEIVDSDGDGTQELVLTGAVFRHHDFTQWSRLDRGDLFTWRWNGSMFEMACKHEATPAEFRVQLLVDASDSLVCGDVEGAIAAYEQLIADDSLLPWTAADNLCPGCDPESGDYTVRVDIAKEEGRLISDPAEWPRLVVYARFRLMQIYVHEGDESAVLEQLEALGNLEADAPGVEYVRLAEVYWQAFEESGEIENACQAVTQAAEGITSPLVNYNFLIYEPLDEPLCAF